MSDFDKNIEAALEGQGGDFDPERARVDREAIEREFRRKLKLADRSLWVLLYLLVAAAIYALTTFNIHATTPKGWIGSGLAVGAALVIIIQKTLLYKITRSQLAMMKEMKELRLGLAGGAGALAAGPSRPLRGISRWEWAGWMIGFYLLIAAISNLSARTNRQDDLWRVKAQGQVEAHSVLTLKRMPHEIRPFFSLRGPVAGAMLQRAFLNGQPVPFSRYQDQFTIQLPYRASWKRDTVELVWAFPLEAARDGAALRAPLRAIMPVHAYTLTLQVEPGSGYVIPGDSWRFNKSPEELKNEAEARRTVKLFTQGGSDGPRDDFGSCGVTVAPQVKP